MTQILRLLNLLNPMMLMQCRKNVRISDLSSLKSIPYIRWDTAPKVLWNHRLNGNVQSWVERSDGHVDFYITHFLIGHGYFRLSVIMAKAMYT